VDTEGLLTLRFNMSIKGMTNTVGSTSDALQKDHHLRLTLKGNPASGDVAVLTRVKSWKVVRSVREAEMGIRVEFEEP
jgi:hypothetical protein